MEHQNEEFKQFLYDTDYLEKLVREIFTRYMNFIDDENEDGGEYILTGSCAEGGVNPRCLYDTKRKFEADMLHVVGRIHDKTALLFEKEKIYVKVKYHSSIFDNIKGKKTASGYVSRYLNEHQSEEFIPNAAFKSVLAGQEWDEREKDRMLFRLQLLVGLPLKVDREVTTDGPATTQIIKITVEEVEGVKLKAEHMVDVMTDNVAAIACMFWPCVASDWKTRSSNWPSEETKRLIIQSGVHVVPKHLPANDPNRSTDIDGKYQWRLSFSIAEKLLFDTLSDDHLSIWNAFKAIFYMHLKEFKVKNISCSTYIFKTTFLFWMEESKGIKLPLTPSYFYQCVKHLLLRVQYFMLNRYVPHYFVKEVNIISHYPSILCDQLHEKLTIITANVEQYFSFKKINGIIRELCPPPIEKILLTLNEHFKNSRQGKNNGQGHVDRFVDMVT